MTAPLFEFLTRLGDNTLVLGHRLTEWCGPAPVPKDKIAQARTALDLIGQTQNWLGLAGKIEGAGRTADMLAFRRDADDFRNLLLLEQPNGDFGQLMIRQFLFDAWHLPYLSNLMSCRHDRIAAIAEKSVKEVTSHLERSSDAVISLGEGTPESRVQAQKALDQLFPFAGEMFVADGVDKAAEAEIGAPDPASLRDDYDSLTDDVFTAAALTRPDWDFSRTGGKSGARHTEHLGHMLQQMLWLQRAKLKRK